MVDTWRQRYKTDKQGGARYKTDKQGHERYKTDKQGHERYKTDKQVGKMPAGHIKGDTADQNRFYSLVCWTAFLNSRFLSLWFVIVR